MNTEIIVAYLFEYVNGTTKIPLYKGGDLQLIFIMQ